MSPLGRCAALFWKQVKVQQVNDMQDGRRQIRQWAPHKMAASFIPLFSRTEPHLGFASALQPLLIKSIGRRRSSGAAVGIRRVFYLHRWAGRSDVNQNANQTGLEWNACLRRTVKHIVQLGQIASCAVVAHLSPPVAHSFQLFQCNQCPQMMTTIRRKYVN